MGSHFLSPQREEEPGAGNGKREIQPKVNGTQGFVILGHPNWTICVLLKLILFQNFTTFVTFIMGDPISYYPRERKQQGFVILGHSNWTICCLLSWFCWTKFHLSDLYTSGSHFLLPNREEAAGSGNGEKGFTQKWMGHRGLWSCGNQTGPFATC